MKLQSVVESFMLSEFYDAMTGGYLFNGRILPFQNKTTISGKADHRIIEMTPDISVGGCVVFHSEGADIKYIVGRTQLKDFWSGYYLRQKRQAIISNIEANIHSSLSLLQAWANQDIPQVVEFGNINYEYMVDLPKSFNQDTNKFDVIFRDQADIKRFNFVYDSKQDNLYKVINYQVIVDTGFKSVTVELIPEHKQSLTVEIKKDYDPSTNTVWTETYNDVTCIVEPFVVSGEQETEAGETPVHNDKLISCLKLNSDVTLGSYFGDYQVISIEKQDTDIVVAHCRHRNHV